MNKLCSRTETTLVQVSLMALLFAFGTVDVSHAATVILSNGTRVEGTTIRASRNGDIILTTAAGQQTFPKGQYTKAIADKPPAFDQARTLAGQGKHDEAIALLEKIAVEYRFLEWDNNAMNAIAQIETTRGNHAAAVEVYERLLRQAPELKEDANVQVAYRSALLSAKMFDKLMPVLDQVISKGSRSEAAKAQIMRGDVRMSQGQLDAAVMDYLRTAILFEAETTIQPEALFKAGEGLEQLRDPRAKDMYRKLVQNYPTSTFAQEARSKM